MIVKPAEKAMLRILWAFLLSLLFVFIALSGQYEKRVQVQITSPGIIETKTGNSITVAFRVSNLTQQTHEFIAETELPEGWKLIARNFPFKLEPGENTIRLVGFFVPFKTLSGHYQIGYTVGAKDDSSIIDRDMVDVEVLLEKKLKIQILKAPRIVVAGEKYQACFLIINKGNAPSDIDLEIESGEGYSYSCDVSKLRLDVEESRQVNVTVKTESRVYRSLKHRLQLTAADTIKETVRECTATLVDVVPRISGKEDYYHRLPAEITFIGLSNESSGSAAQLELSGLGSIENKGIKKIDFSFRGPGKREFLTFGFRREEYRLGLDTTRGNIYLGDHVFYLSKLTEYGNYGRGIEGEFFLGNFTLKAYYQKNLVIGPRQKQRALQFSYSLGKKGKLYFNHLANKKNHLPEDLIYSLQTQFFSRRISLNLEYARGKKKSEQMSKTDNAFWMEAFGDINKKFHYRLNVMRAGANYPGCYRDLVFNSAYFSFLLLRNLGIRASYNKIKRHLRQDPVSSATNENITQFGMQYHFKNLINFSLDYRSRERKALFPTPLFNYKDTMLRIGVSPHFGSLNFHALVDFGNTYNKLSGQSRSLVEYDVYGFLTLFRKLFFGGHFQLANQNNNFTGDKERRVNISFNMKLNLGKTAVYSYYRTSWHHEFYDKILYDQSLAGQLLFNHLNLLEISLKHRLPNGHSIALRMRHASNSYASPGQKTNIIGLIEYSIPLGIPVSRKPDMGELRGKVYDAENSEKGIAGVILKVSGYNTVTNKKGIFVFRSLKQGQYYLDIEETTLGPDRAILQNTPMKCIVEGSKKAELNIGVVRSAGIRGRIMVYCFENPDSKQYILRPTDKQKRKLIEGYGLANAVIELKNENSIYRQITDGQGYFNFEELRPGKWTLKVYDNSVPVLHYIEKDTLEFELVPGRKENLLIKVLPQIRKIKIIEKGSVSFKENGEQKSR